MNVLLEARGKHERRWERYPDYMDSGIEWLGEVPEGWDVKRLKYVCCRSALYGANEPSDRYLEEGVRFLRTSDIDECGELNQSKGVYVARSVIREYLLEDGDLLISRSGTLGRSFIYDKKSHGECAYAGYLVRFSFHDNMVPRFVFYGIYTITPPSLRTSYILIPTIHLKCVHRHSLTRN